jgi:uncharacterized oxidoreductase
MNMNDNTILITGGGSGIGRALAEAFFALGNKVIIAGRRQSVLDEVTAANPGMVSRVLDIEDPKDIRVLAKDLVAKFPNLNVLINNAGIMRNENLLAAEVDLVDAEATITTNLLGPIRLTSALLPHLRTQSRAVIMNVSSGLAFMPRADSPTYCATKAAIHSYSMAMRYQLQHTSVQVIELIPPYVQTELTGQRQANDPSALPLKDFIAETMSILSASPSSAEVCVERVKPLRFAAGDGYDAFFKRFNDGLAAAR